MCVKYFIINLKNVITQIPQSQQIIPIETEDKKERKKNRKFL